MKILVIGGTWFIGRCVTQQLLQEGHEVSVFNRGVTPANLPQQVTHIRGDRQNLTDYRQTFQQLAPDVVIDMIALTEAHARSTMETFKGVARRIVTISSQDVYRARDILWGRETGMIDPVPLAEDAPLRSQLYPYQAVGIQSSLPPDYDKILVERVVASDSSLPGTVLRLPMVYGVGDYQHRFYPYIKRMDDKHPVIVLEEGYAHWHGCYGYVENVAAAIVLAATDERATNRTYNVAESSVLSQAELIGAIGQIVGWRGDIVIASKIHLPPNSVSLNTEQDWLTDSTRIREELGYTETIARDEALRRTIAWERANPPEVFSATGLLDYAIEDAILASR